MTTQSPVVDLSTSMPVAQSHSHTLNLTSDNDQPPFESRFAITGRLISGADRIVLESALLTLSPSTSSIGVDVYNNPPTTARHTHTLNINQPGRVKSLRFTGFGYRNNEDEWDLHRLNNNRRILVSVRNANGDWLPLYSCPDINARGAIPAMLGGASFNSSQRILTFSRPIDATQLRVGIVEGGLPEDFNFILSRLERVRAELERVAVNLTLAGEDDAVHIHVPALHTGPQAVDLRLPLNLAFKNALNADQDPSLTLTLTSDAPANIVLNYEGAQGSYVRSFPDVVRTVLEGEPSPLDMGPLESPLAAETPTARFALNARYEGVRLVRDLCDPLPAPRSRLSGRIVSSTSQTVDLPPDAFANYPPARIGVIGYAQEPCDLVLSLVHPQTGAPVLEGGKVSLAPSLEPDLVWFTLPDGDPPGPVRVSLQTGKGRFFWVADPLRDLRPLVWVAVYDPEPGGRSLYLDQDPLLNISQTTVTGNFSLGAFGGAVPVLHSDLFLTVDFSDLELEYTL